MCVCVCVSVCVCVCVYFVLILCFVMGYVLRFGEIAHKRAHCYYYFSFVSFVVPMVVYISLSVLLNASENHGTGDCM